MTFTVAAVFVALLVLPLFDLAWGVGGAVQAVAYPSSWQRVAERIDDPGDVAVLPGGMFRKFRYSGAAPALDPAPRMLPDDVLQTGELPVRGRTVTGEGTRAAEVETLLLHGGSASDLARLGVGWVLVELATPDHSARRRRRSLSSSRGTRIRNLRCTACPASSSCADHRRRTASSPVRPTSFGAQFLSPAR